MANETVYGSESSVIETCEIHGNRFIREYENGDVFCVRCDCLITPDGRMYSSIGSSAAPLQLQPGPKKENIDILLKRTGYNLVVTREQRIYGGPPPNWISPPPLSNCKVFCYNIPTSMYEDVLIPLFEKCGTIWDLQLAMDPLTNLNRGYAFVTFTTTEAAQEAVNQVDGLEVKDCTLAVCIPDSRIALSFIDTTSKFELADLLKECRHESDGLREVTKVTNQDQYILKYNSGELAAMAMFRFATKRAQMFGSDIVLGWADPEPQSLKLKSRILHTPNFHNIWTEPELRGRFHSYGVIDVILKKSYALLIFERIDKAKEAFELNNTYLNGQKLCLTFYETKNQSDEPPLEVVSDTESHCVMGNIANEKKEVEFLPLSPPNSPEVEEVCPKEKVLESTVLSVVGQVVLGVKRGSASEGEIQDVLIRDSPSV